MYLNYLTAQAAVPMDRLIETLDVFKQRWMWEESEKIPRLIETLDVFKRRCI